MSFFHEIKQRIERGMEQAGQTSQRMIEMGRYNSRIKAKKEEIEEAISRLGWSVYHTRQSGESLDESTEVARNMKQVGFLQDQLADLEKKLESISNSTGNASAERVDSTDPGQEIVPQDQPLVPATNLIYICPYCAHQVQEQDRACSSCKHTYY